MSISKPWIASQHKDNQWDGSHQMNQQHDSKCMFPLCLIQFTQLPNHKECAIVKNMKQRIVKLVLIREEFIKVVLTKFYIKWASIKSCNTPVHTRWDPANAFWSIGHCQRHGTRTPLYMQRLKLEFPGNVCLEVVHTHRMCSKQPKIDSNKLNQPNPDVNIEKQRFRCLQCANTVLQHPERVDIQIKI